MAHPIPLAIATRALAAAASLVVAVGLVTATGATSAAAAASRHHVAHGPARQCTAVADVLSDGPTLTADPVGYAEAQILPLRQLHLSYAPLRHAVEKLAAAYKAYSSDGAHKAEVKVAADEKRVDAICPKAAP